MTLALIVLIPLLVFVALGVVATLLFGWAIPALGGDGNAWYGAAIKTLFILLGFVLPLSSILTWMERRQSAMMQDRLGPNRAHIGSVTAFGLLHFVADALKMIFKEDFVPAKANRFLFGIAPILAIAPVLITFAIIPWGAPVCPGRLFEILGASDYQQCVANGGVRLQTVHLEVGMLFYFAIASLAVYGTTLAGWSSYNKWSLLGGLRASSQMMSYEVTMGLAVLGAFLVYGTLEPSKIVEAQGSNPLHWGLVTQPLGLILFFTAAVAETKRAPFDTPEGESEIVGYFLEYSGMRFGMFFLAEFMEVIFVGATVTTIFLGGWQLPGLGPDGFSFWHLPHFVVSVLHFVTFAAKVFILCWFQLMVRWTVPRFRPDQLMRLGWKQLLPASLANILITAVAVLYFLGGKPQ